MLFFASIAVSDIRDQSWIDVMDQSWIDVMDQPSGMNSFKLAIKNEQFIKLLCIHVPSATSHHPENEGPLPLVTVRFWAESEAHTVINFPFMSFVEFCRDMVGWNEGGGSVRPSSSTISTMSKICARPECGKVVYPLEELKCLDKVWHKQCFKCTVCGMTLSMKNYKGYDKLPYCEPHYPKTVASVVVDTPEMRRLAENTRLQSQVKYHEEFEKSKGQKIEIADDPELARHLRNTRVQSQVAYHGEIEKKKLQDEVRPPAEQHSATANGQTTPYNVPESPSSYVPVQMPATGSTPYSSRLAAQSGTVIYSSEQGGKVPIQQRQVGSIADYDPLNGNWGTVGSSRAAEKIASMSGTKGGPHQTAPTQASAVNGAQGVGAKKNMAAGTGFTVKALYDYTAADKDEVTFVEGDIIVNCQKVDEGWMTGTVKRTLQWGMLPANYVEQVKQPTGLHYLS
ncbi:unnamed protein product [Toxocara canis]|uniref:LIM and SH3 domain protein F42H10.3 n=1 Tax=Toxocara canis TaxID=6265 RepID=A0A183UFP6_TOXCA|nr:unnamed protein product [Toxocara canis]